jgi:hypothetical protein
MSCILPKKEKPIVCFDFDGVLAFYDGWKSDGSIGLVNPVGAELAKELHSRGFIIKIQSCRTNPQFGDDAKKQILLICSWLNENDIPCDELVLEGKCLAHVYIDDRAVAFPRNGGSPQELLYAILRTCDLKW